MHENFLAGVVEGFYGQTWTQDQRSTLFQWMSDWGLNTYFYAPKDDLKHRAIWRETYDQQELATLTDLITNCSRHGLRFVYGLSPGLDIRFSDPQEIDQIKRRFNQLIRSGVRHFALLFDDLPGKLSQDEIKSFDSVAAAQCFVANSIFAWLRTQFHDSQLMFCPTPYCDRMDGWRLGGEGYLDDIGRTLTADIEFLWTGPEIISREISVDSIGRLSDRIGRAPLIWDNLHANDYDLRRLYCGPYCGRTRELLNSVRGVLANTNNEFWINFVPLRTMSSFFADPSNYRPREAFVSATTEWAQQFETIDGNISVEDVRLLADCYYLPHEEGEEAGRLKAVVADLVQQPVESWGDKYEQFLALHQRIMTIFEGLTQLKNRELFYAWSRRVWELREEMDLFNDFLTWKKANRAPSLGFESETHLRYTYRGGMVAELQRLLSMDEAGRFHCSE